MSQKPENRMLSRLKPRFKAAGFFVEKTNNPYRAGIPDWYIERDMIHIVPANGWIEAKFRNVKKPNSDPEYEVAKIRSMLSPHQEKWLQRAVDNGQNAAILCGYPDTKIYVFFDYSATTHPTLPVYTLDELLQVTNKWLSGSLRGD